MTQENTKENDRLNAYKEIEALLDGELDPLHAELLREKIRKEFDLSMRFHALNRQKELLKKWWNMQSYQ